MDSRNSIYTYHRPSCWINILYLTCQLDHAHPTPEDLKFILNSKMDQASQSRDAIPYSSLTDSEDGTTSLPTTITPKVFPKIRHLTHNTAILSLALKETIMKMTSTRRSSEFPRITTTMRMKMMFSMAR